VADGSFREYVEDQLRALGAVEFHTMFGGYGLYRGPFFFGILHRGRLYFKTDSDSRPEYVARGMGPFRPNVRQTLKSYYEVPAEVIEDADALIEWARRAIAARSAPAPRTAVRRKAKTRSQR
jgi:DNA transformation protein